MVGRIHRVCHLCFFCAAEFPSPFSYSALKKQIYTLEAEATAPGHPTDVERGERSALLGEHSRRATNSTFKPLLDDELAKIVAFYDQQEKELLYDVVELEQLVVKTEEEGINPVNADDSEGSDEDEDDYDGQSNSGAAPGERRRSGSQSRLMSSTRTLGNQVNCLFCWLLTSLVSSCVYIRRAPISHFPPRAYSISSPNYARRQPRP